MFSGRCYPEPPTTQKTPGIALQNLDPRFKSGRRLQILNSVNTVTYGYGLFQPIVGLGNSWEQFALQRFNRLAV